MKYLTPPISNNSILIALLGIVLVVGSIIGTNSVAAQSQSACTPGQFIVLTANGLECQSLFTGSCAAGQVLQYTAGGSFTCVNARSGGGGGGGGGGGTTPTATADHTHETEYDTTGGQGCSASQASRWDGNAWQCIGIGGGPPSTLRCADEQFYLLDDSNQWVCHSPSFVGLVDTPGSWESANRAVTVNADGDGLKFGGSVAEGYFTTASGDHSHAEGQETTASGANSHAEGRNTTASDDQSHAEGYGTFASGEASHAGGSHTAVNNDHSRIIGLRGVVGDDNTIFGIAWGAGIPNTADRKASRDKNLVFKVQTDGDVYARDYYRCNSTTAVSATGTGCVKLPLTGGGGGASTFLALSDTPSAWPTNNANNRNRIITVNGTNTGIKFGGSVAEGEQTTASGTNSHAEGRSTTASGSASHAEGQQTTASGINSHAEGRFTTASGFNSHAEGSDTTASGSYSHAEGQATTASGFNSHAEGSDTTASGSYSHAGGYYTAVNNESARIIGRRGVVGAPDTLFGIAWQTANSYVPTTSDKNTGTAGNNDKNLVFKVQTDGDVYGRNFYDCSATSGNINTHSGCTLLGTSGASTFLALSDTPSAWPTNNANNRNRIITVNGTNTGIKFGGSVAEGSNTIASGSNSHAEGRSTTASGNHSHAEGYGTTASGTNSHAEGYNTTASGYYSHAEGYGTTASGFNSHAEGRSTTAPGTYSHAEGQSTTASGIASHAEGWGSTASGHYSHAEGQGTTASGPNSHAGGLYTIARTDGARVIGHRGLVGHPDTLFGIAAGESTPTDADQQAREDKHLKFKVQQDGDVYGNNFYDCSATEASVDGHSNCVKVTTTNDTPPVCASENSFLQWTGVGWRCAEIEKQWVLLFENESGERVTTANIGTPLDLNHDIDDSSAPFKTLVFVRDLHEHSNGTGVQFGHYTHAIPVSRIPTSRNTNISIGGEEGGSNRGDDAKWFIWRNSNNGSQIRLQDPSGGIAYATLYQIWGLRGSTEDSVSTSLWCNDSKIARVFCEENGGSVISVSKGTGTGTGSCNVCRFNKKSSNIDARCPSGFLQYENWSTTTARTVYNASDCIGQTGEGCTTGSHNWKNAVRESCENTYLVPRFPPTYCTRKRSTHHARVDQIGCVPG